MTAKVLQMRPVAMHTPVADRHELLADLHRQLPALSGRGRERTERAIKQLEWELAPGQGAAERARRQLDMEEEQSL